ncbi:MAG TPA: nuclear transport factor 2 family protein [Pyrinomonadaceae bacterium]|jgi:hypothetical protein|nr:nuclear transport factor 2 family protein [Pyrinomonadaceae bacterium]
MKKLNVTVILILAFASVAFGQRGQAAPEVSRLSKDSRKTTAEADAKALKETLVNLEKQSWVAWQKRDGKFYQGFLSDEHVEMGAGGTANKTEIVAFVGSPACVVRSYAVEKFELTVLDADTALLTYHAAQDTTCNGTAVPSPAWVSSLYVRRGDRWLNAFYQQTPAHK